MLQLSAIITADFIWLQQTIQLIRISTFILMISMANGLTLSMLRRAVSTHPFSLMKMENVRILKEMRNTVNRKVNCETANINKTVSAAAKQAEDIAFIQKTIGVSKMPDTLQEVARLRLAHPEASLKELAEHSTSEIGKSGINHRLRKLSEIAEELRENKEEQTW